jgi:hypothetical protein
MLAGGCRRQDAVAPDRGEKAPFRHRQAGLSEILSSEQMRYRFGGDRKAVWQEILKPKPPATSDVIY